MVDNQMIPKLRQQIKSPNSQERRQAVDVLSEFKGSKVAGVAANIILEVLEDSNQSVRQAARDSLIELGEAGIKALEGMLYCHDWDADYVAWQTAKDILVSLGNNAVDSLLQILQRGDDCAKSSALTILAEIGDSRVISPVLSKLNDDKVPFTDAVKALASLRGISVPQQLGELTHSEKTTVLAKARKALAQIQASQPDLTSGDSTLGDMRINDPQKYDKPLL